MATGEHPLAAAVDAAVTAAGAEGSALGELARVLARQVPEAGMAAAAVSRELRATLAALSGDDDDRDAPLAELLEALAGPV